MTAPRSEFYFLRPLEKVYKELKNPPSPELKSPSAAKAKSFFFPFSKRTSEAKIAPTPQPLETKLPTESQAKGFGLVDHLLNLFRQLGSARNINGDVAKEILAGIQNGRAQKEFAFLNPFFDEAERRLDSFLKPKIFTLYKLAGENFTLKDFVESLIDYNNRFKGSGRGEESLIKGIRALQQLYENAELDDKEIIFLRIQSIQQYILLQNFPETITNVINGVYKRCENLYARLPFEKRQHELQAIYTLKLQPSHHWIR